MNKLYHVAVGFADKPKPHTEIQKAFEHFGWARYAPNCWIVSTWQPPAELANKIRALVSEADSIFVVEIIKANNGGFLHKEIWEWINQQK